MQQHQRGPRQAQPAAHVLENLMELKGQKGKQGLRLARPEAKLGTNSCLFSHSFILPTRPRCLLHYLDFNFLIWRLQNIYSCHSGQGLKVMLSLPRPVPVHTEQCGCTLAASLSSRIPTYPSNATPSSPSLPSCGTRIFKAKA